MGNPAPYTFSGLTYVIPCSGPKLAHPAPARYLYTGRMFRNTLAAAEAALRFDVEGGHTAYGRVLVMSALYGLVASDQMLDPYDQRMDRPGAISSSRLTEQATALGMNFDSGTVYALLPRAYFRPLYDALEPLYVGVIDLYEAAPGIGHQRRVNRNISRPNVGAQIQDALVNGRESALGRARTAIDAARSARLAGGFDRSSVAAELLDQAAQLRRGVTEGRLGSRAYGHHCTECGRHCVPA